MNRSLSLLSAVLIGLLSVASPVTAPVAAADPPPAPAEIELKAASDNSITVIWPASPGATSYRIYRGTSSGGQGSTPIGTATTTSYKDNGLSTTPVYYYQVSAVNAAGESPRSEEHASKTPPPVGTGGNLPGVASGNSLIFYCKDALLGGFDWFQTLNGWFPSILGSSGSTSPGRRVVDMAYADEGSMTFNNVVVPTAGLYSIGWRYAFQGGLFPGVTNRKMGLAVNGTVITRTQSFPITGSFDVYQTSVLQVQLRAGVNSVSQIAVSEHGLSRVDQMIVTPASAPLPAGPSNLRGTASDKSVALAWNAGSGATSYAVYRGTKSDGEAVTPIATVTGTSFTDTGLTNGRTYFYHVQAFNSVGGSALTNEISAIPVAGGGGTAPAAPTGLNAVPGNGSVGLTWAASAGATNYSVFRGTSPGGQGGTAIGTVTGTSFTDTGLTNGTRYHYKVRAANAAGSSGLSAEVSAVPGTTGSPPGVPFGVVITPRDGNILLQWGFMSAATGYNVYRSTSPGAETLLIQVTSPTHVDRAVTPGVTYYYQFTATNAGGESARTAEFPATAR